MTIRLKRLTDDYGTAHSFRLLIPFSAFLYFLKIALLCARLLVPVLFPCCQKVPISALIILNCVSIEKRACSCSSVRHIECPISALWNDSTLDSAFSSYSDTDVVRDISVEDVPVGISSRQRDSVTQKTVSKKAAT